MDPLSHAVVGASFAASCSPEQKLLRVAIFCGVLAGTMPDLDVLIRDADNPMLGLKYHRFFTHALFFAPIGAFIAASALYFLKRRLYSFSHLYMFCFVAWFLHGVLDAMTNYGTHLFWPFTMRRESLSIISIIDPLFTLPLLTLVILTYINKARCYALIAVVYACCYWGIGYYQREQATVALFDLAQQRGHKVDRYEVKPSLGNLLAWRIQYMTQDKIYVDAVHVSPWKGRIYYEGDVVKRAVIPQHLPKGLPAMQQQDAVYFNFFSDGWVAFDPDRPDMLGDIRFAMLPNQISPLWAIEFSHDRPDSHVQFVQLRERNEGDLARLWAMICGRI